MNIGNVQYALEQPFDSPLNNPYFGVNQWYAMQTWGSFLGCCVSDDVGSPAKTSGMPRIMPVEKLAPPVSQNQSISNGVSSVDFFPSEATMKCFWEVAGLEDNWNENGAKKFSNNLLKKVYILLCSLAIQPLLYPTACGSIQLEYEKENGEYLEFEVFEENTHVFLIDKDGREKEWTLDSADEQRIERVINEFYVQNE